MPKGITTGQELPLPLTKHITISLFACVREWRT